MRVGTIAIRTGNPDGTDPWQWSCGFYPGSHPRECTSGTSATCKEARADFAAAWRVLLANRTEADFQAWRDHQARTAEKCRRFDRGEPIRVPDAGRYVEELPKARARERATGLDGSVAQREDGRRDLTLLRLYGPVRVEIALRIVPGFV